MSTKNVIIECDVCKKVYEVKNDSHPVVGMVSVDWSHKRYLSQNHSSQTTAWGSLDVCNAAGCITASCAQILTSAPTDQRVSVVFERREIPDLVAK